MRLASVEIDVRILSVLKSCKTEGANQGAYAQERFSNAWGGMTEGFESSDCVCMYDCLSVQVCCGLVAGNNQSESELRVKTTTIFLLI